MESLQEHFEAAHADISSNSESTMQPFVHPVLVNVVTPTVQD
jgi:hypothetical protein